MTPLHRALLFSFSTLCLLAGLLSSAPPSRAAGLVDVPLKPWTYFDLNRDWMYTAIEKLVNAGLVGPWVLNTKPMSRVEMARVVTVALRKVQEDESGRFSRRTDLEPTLYELMDELAPELEAMMALTGNDAFAGQPWLSVQPISKLQARGFYVRQDARPENSQGLRLSRHYTGTVGFASYMQIDDYMSAYIHPEFQGEEHDQKNDIVEGYVKLKWNNLALRLGRESVWWGPGYHGSMLFGNNAPPLDQVRIGTAEPIILPWVFKYLGPTRMELMYAQLEANRDYPHTILGSWRVNFSPSPLMELGVARAVQMGGQGRPPMGTLDYLAALVISSDDGNSKYNTNQLYTLDATLRLHDVDRVFPLSRDLSIYAEMGVDDTCCKNILWPLKPGYLVGAYLPNLFGRNDTELRVEWAATTSFSYTHGIYTTGYSYEGFPIAHYVGSKGQDLYIRTAERVLPTLQIGTELGFAKIGPTTLDGLSLPREKRNFAGLDITYQPTKALSMLMGYRYERIDNKGFVEGERATNHTLRLEATYSFDTFEKGLFGREKRAEALRPVTPPPASRAQAPPDIDPEEILSGNYATRVVKDTGYTLTSPLRWDTQDWLIFSGVAATTGGLMFADKGIRNFVLENRTEASDTLANVFRPFEEVVPVVLVAGMAGVGYAFENPKLKAASADALEASLISVVGIAAPTKFLTGRSRPDRNEGPTHYSPFNLGSSLPSFTTANAFAVASVLSEHFPNPAVSVFAYGLAGAAGLARVYDDKHWMSDVFLGAAIGTVVGKLVVKLNENRRAGSRLSVVPLTEGGVRGAALQIAF